MELSNRYCLSERSKRVQPSTKLDGCCIQRYDGIIEFNAARLKSIEVTSDSDQELCRIHIGDPIANLLRVGQDIEFGAPSKARVKEFRYPSEKKYA